jgi:cyclophilin family peptidyl-prolyl cis-trans isomerase
MKGKHVKSIAKMTAGLAVSALLAACGGGTDETSITAGPLMYHSVAHFTVEGPNLDKGITLVAPQCSGIAELAGSTPNRRDYNCTPTATGTIVVSVVGGNVVLRSAGFAVPLPQVTLKTSLGNMVLELYPPTAPLTVNNLLQYVADGFYSNLIFHRVIPNFVVQGGGFDSALVQATTRAPIKLETPNGLTNIRGSLAMARTALPDSATSQFFINVVDDPSLDYVSSAQPGYAVFGKVVDGMGVADAIAAVPTGARSNGMKDVPLTDVLILSAVQTR